MPNPERGFAARSPSFLYGSPLRLGEPGFVPAFFEFLLFCAEVSRAEVVVVRGIIDAKAGLFEQPLHDPIVGAVFFPDVHLHLGSKFRVDVLFQRAQQGIEARSEIAVSGGENDIEPKAKSWAVTCMSILNYHKVTR